MAVLLYENCVLLSHHSFVPLHFLVPADPSDRLRTCLLLAGPALTPEDYNCIAVFKLHKNNVPLPSPVFLMATFFILTTDRWDVLKITMCFYLKASLFFECCRFLYLSNTASNCLKHFAIYFAHSLGCSCLSIYYICFL